MAAWVMSVMLQGTRARFDVVAIALYAEEVQTFIAFFLFFLLLFAVMCVVRRQP